MTIEEAVEKIMWLDWTAKDFRQKLTDVLKNFKLNDSEKDS